MSANLTNAVSKIVEGLREGLNTTTIFNRESVAKYVVSQESIAIENREVVQNDVKNIDNLINDVIINMGISSESYTNAQVDAARKIAALSLNPSTAKENQRSLKASPNAVLPLSIGVEDYLNFDEVTIATEAYDGQKTDNCFLFSVAYNFVASKQDEFGEAFYPTIVIDPTTSDIVMEVKFASIMNELKRGIDGTPNRKQFKKIPLTKAIYNNELFATDKNKIVPVLRDENRKYFLESEKRIDDSTLETIATAPLIFGKTIGLLAISQTDSLLARGQMDNTDALDRAITLERVYVSLTGDSGKEIFKINTSGMSFNGFTHNPQDHNKDMILNFSRQQFIFNTTETKTSKNAESVILKALPEGYIVAVEVSIKGEANTQYGDVELFGLKAEVVAIRNKSGDLISESEADYKSIAKAFESLAFEGYELLAYTTNSNLRKRGQLITTDTFKQPYMVPNRSGIMSIVPVNNDTGTDNDTDAIIGQAQACGAKISISAVEELMRHVDLMKYITNDGTYVDDLTVQDHGFKGIAKYLLTPAFEHRTIDLTQIVASLDSKSRDESIRAALLQQIFNVGMALYIKSNYGVVFERVINGSSNGRATLIVGCDPNIKRLLVTATSGDTIQLGTMFDIKIVSTFNSKLNGKIVFSFGVYDDQRNSVPNALNFGNCAYAPTIVYDLVRDINGQTSREKHNNPRYLHITHLPVVGIFDVNNIEQVFGQIALPVVNA